METVTLIITSRNAFGILQRILGVIEVRGWMVQSLTFSTDDDDARIWIDVTPRPHARSAENLRRQIAGLYDVREVI